MVIEGIYSDGAQVNFDLEDLRILRAELSRIDPDRPRQDPLTYTAAQAIAAAFHALVTACENLRPAD